MYFYLISAISNNFTNNPRSPTDSTQQWWDGVPDTDAAHAEPLSYSQLQVEQGDALKH